MITHAGQAIRIECLNETGQKDFEATGELVIKASPAENRNRFGFDSL